MAKKIKYKKNQGIITRTVSVDDEDLVISNKAMELEGLTNQLSTINSRITELQALATSIQASIDELTPL